MMNNLKIITESQYIPEISDHEKALFFFSYVIKIKNDSMQKVQLISRHWDIEDSLGRTKIVDGEGVVGKKPFINPGEYFKYKSFCPLNTSFGYMEGFYTFRNESGNIFKLDIPKFGLIAPNFIN